MLLYKSHSVESEPFRVSARHSSANGRYVHQARSNCGDGKPKEGKMSNQYLVNLTNDLIRKSGYDLMAMRGQELRKHIFNHLAFGWIEKLSIPKLAEIISSFEINEIGSKDQVYGLADGFLDGRNMLERLASACLAIYIENRLYCPERYDLPPFSRRTA